MLVTGARESISSEMPGGAEYSDHLPPAPRQSIAVALA
jgi:hypothetical protein